MSVPSGVKRWGFWVTLLALRVTAWGQDPSVVGQWSAVKNWPISATHAHLLPTGEVMFSGEFDTGTVAYLWNPTTDALSTLPPPGYNIFCAGHSQLPDGRVLIAGGHLANDRGLPDAVLFDPFSHSWSRLPDMTDGRWYPTSTTLSTGEAVVLVGATETGATNVIPDVFDPATSSWRRLTTASLDVPYYPWTFAAPNGRVFYAGYRPQSRWLDTRGTGAWQNGPTTRYGSSRNYGTATMYEPGKVAIFGGDDPPTNTVEVIDLNASSPAWRSVAAMRHPRRQLNSTLLPDGKVLVSGGHSGTGLDVPTAAVLDNDVWDPVTESFTALAPLGTYRGYHSTALLLPDGRVLSAGGRGVTTMQVFSPPYLFKGARPTVSSAPSSANYGTTFSISTADAAAVTKVSLVRLASVTHAFDENQRFVPLTFTRGTGTITATAPSGPTLAPPGYYMLFLLNGNGVPSVAKMIRLGGDGAPPPPPPPPPPGSSVVVIPFADTWHYDARNVDPGPSWTSPSFNDSAWSSGRAQLGYGDGDEATVIPRTSPTQPSLYFRKKVFVDGTVTAAKVDTVHDDGITVWVNGTQVFSRLIGSTAHSAWATGSSADNAQDSGDLPTAPFVSGENTIAVMVKQSSSTSSDVSFDLQLTVTTSGTTQPMEGLMVESPNGGESLRAGSVVPIRWMTHGTVANVKLEYSTNGGTSWQTIVASTPNAGTYDWTVPNVDTALGRVRVTSVDSPTVQDASDGNFAISTSTTYGGIAFGDFWRFDDRNVDPGPSWNTLGFDDSAWKSGAGQFGYGDGDERTVIAKTSPVQPTVYFRKKITVGGTLSAAQLQLIHDDGVAVFVNGVKVFSKYVGSLAHSSYATSSSTDNERSNAAIDPTAFVVGDNVIAVMVKQSSSTSSDVSFDLALTLTEGTPPPPPPVGSTPIAFGATWKYDDRNVDNGTGWVALGFNDSAWPSGAAQLGYGDGDEATALRRTSPNQPSLYFRKKFDLSTAVSGASLKVVHDDGVAVWINGTLVYSNLVGSTAFSAYATGSSTDNQLDTATIPASALVTGQNVIAVMVKQSSGTSSDVSFDLQLEVSAPP